MCHPLLSSDAGEDSHWAGCQVAPGTRAHLTRVQATAAPSARWTSESRGWDTASRPGLGEVEGLVVSTETGSDPAPESGREKVTLPTLLLPRGPGHCFKRGPLFLARAWRRTSGWLGRASAGSGPDSTLPRGASLCMPTWA